MAVTHSVRDGAWRVLEMITTPLVPADYLDAIAPLRNPAVLRAKVESVTAETGNSATLLLRAGRGWKPHRPGQYVRLGVDVDGVRLWRSYSVTSAPGGSHFTITVNLVTGGPVSTRLVRHTRPGTILHLDLPTGDFTLPAAAPERALFVTAGSGVTPVMGMLRSHRGELGDVVIVHSARTPEDVVFGRELRERAACGELRLIERHTRAQGRLCPDELESLVPDAYERETWACGPNGLLDELEVRWASAGATDRLRTERFRPAVIAGGGGGEVDFTRTGKSVVASGARPILEAGEAAGVLMPSGCRMGICFGCVAKLREGAVRDLRDGQLTVAEPGDDIGIQTCISAAAGPCRIDL
jgi:stearoyl-CoA 9-desaturase NADPH oxidoreductase